MSSGTFAFPSRSTEARSAMPERSKGISTGSAAPQAATRVAWTGYPRCAGFNWRTGRAAVAEDLSGTDPSVAVVGPNLPLLTSCDRDRSRTPCGHPIAARLAAAPVERHNKLTTWRRHQEPPLDVPWKQMGPILSLVVGAISSHDPIWAWMTGASCRSRGAGRPGHVAKPAGNSLHRQR